MKGFFLIWFLCLFSTLPSHVGQVCHLGSNMTWNINKGNSHVLHEVASFLFWLVLRKEGKVFYCCSSMRTFLTYTIVSYLVLKMNYKFLILQYIVRVQMTIMDWLADWVKWRRKVKYPALCHDAQTSLHSNCTWSSRAKHFRFGAITT